MAPAARSGRNDALRAAPNNPDRFGWEDYHLHAFKLHGRHDGTTWTGERHRDAVLADLQLRVRQRIRYEYDFGDLWEHEIRVEAKLEREGGKVYPVCIGGARAGPPEDIGGPPGYMALVDRIRFGDIDQLLHGDEDTDDDAPLRTFERERFSRREVNAALKIGFSELTRGRPQQVDMLPSPADKEGCGCGLPFNS